MSRQNNKGLSALDQMAFLHTGGEMTHEEVKRYNRIAKKMWLGEYHLISAEDAAFYDTHHETMEYGK